MENLDVNVKNWKSLIKPAKLDVKLSQILFRKELKVILCKPLNNLI